MNSKPVDRENITSLGWVFNIERRVGHRGARLGARGEQSPL
jgi:hypothetical protein